MKEMKNRAYSSPLNKEGCPKGEEVLSFLLTTTPGYAVPILDKEGNHTDSILCYPVEALPYCLMLKSNKHYKSSDIDILTANPAILY
jgi:hypothetical protein